ncbi:hypothetical protein MUK42_34650 [Musa troglodytarum]|uniref:Uncharacterized protein n=1 Tax=Musa troglodytarum TaxID=320322 RepID=A0A9E7KDT2_9LILI|nr:hypothetical protein MUK42_34650 [Musa troglodytarum]
MSDPSRFVFLPTVTTCAGMEVVPVFISVDPERNNVEQVCEYVKGFKEDQLPLYIEELFPRREDTATDRVTGYCWLIQLWAF